MIPTGPDRAPALQQPDPVCCETRLEHRLPIHIELIAPPRGPGAELFGEQPLTDVLTAATSPVNQHRRRSAG